MATLESGECCECVQASKHLCTCVCVRVRVCVCKHFGTSALPLSLTLSLHFGFVHFLLIYIMLFFASVWTLIPRSSSHYRDASGVQSVIRNNNKWRRRLTGITYVFMICCCSCYCCCNWLIRHAIMARTGQHNHLGLPLSPLSLFHARAVNAPKNASNNNKNNREEGNK